MIWRHQEDRHEYSQRHRHKHSQEHRHETSREDSQEHRQGTSQEHSHYQRQDHRYQYSRMRWTTIGLAERCTGISKMVLENKFGLLK